jgi:hypothetical protein
MNIRQRLDKIVEHYATGIKTAKSREAAQC